MEMKTFIECTYEQINSSNIVGNNEQFSTDYLGKSKSSFRAMKAKVLEANTGLLAKLAKALDVKVEDIFWLAESAERPEP